MGSVRNPRFPEQRQISVYKPLLLDVIDSIESFIRENSLQPVNYNIELKTKASTDTLFHPVPAEFSELVYDLISEKQLWNRVTIQSFDFRTLQYFHAKHPEVKLALLIENELSWRSNIDSLGFIPDIYSSYYRLLSQKKVEEIQGSGMKVIPWTVNEISEINKVLAWEVDGIITDYPDRALNATNRK
ncbi:glycerophosphodiester phosphodiesterase family protein [Ekhidna sp.]